MIIWQSPGELLANSWQSPGQLLEVPGQLLANSWQLLASSWQALEPLPEYITELPWTILVRILIGTLTRMPHRAQRSSERRADNTITKNNTFKQHVQTTRLRELIFVIVSFESVDYCYSSVWRGLFQPHRAQRSSERRAKSVRGGLFKLEAFPFEIYCVKCKFLINLGFGKVWWILLGFFCVFWNVSFWNAIWS